MMSDELDVGMDCWNGGSIGVRHHFSFWLHLIQEFYSLQM